MIFYTVGTQLPFDRLTKALDDISNRLDTKIIGQIGKSSYIPSNFTSYQDLSPKVYEQYFSEADLVISHAGMGTILRCISSSKKLIVCPRLAKYSEHRNDHQLDTVSKVAQHACLKVLTDVNKLEEEIKNFNSKEIKVTGDVDQFASPTLIKNLRKLINT